MELQLWPLLNPVDSSDELYIVTFMYISLYITTKLTAKNVIRGRYIT